MIHRSRGAKMKSEKKVNDLNCVQKIILKEEPCADSCKMSENSSSGNNIERSDEDSKHCVRESCGISGNSSGDKKIRKSTNRTNNQQVLIPKKEENGAFPCSCQLSSEPSAPKPDSNTLGGWYDRDGSDIGESQFMQQQSRIFVFSTMMANKSAEAVLRGQFSSIVAYHCAQTGTKHFLEKHPSKGNKAEQPPEWLTNFNAPTDSQKNQQTCSNSLTRQTPELADQNLSRSPFRNEQSATNSRNSNSEKSLGNTIYGNTESSIDDTINNVVNSLPSPHSVGDNVCSSPSSLQPSLHGVKVPDENLTPQQRQHREEQLATIRKMQILLFSDRKEETDGSALASAQSTQPQPFGHSGENSSSDNSLDEIASSVDWDKIQSQLFEPKAKVAADNFTAVTSNDGSLTASSRGQGPPPPYHQSTRPASVPITLQSSNPSSPNNPTSTLSLPSPRGYSGVNSPADCGRYIPSVSQRSGFLPAESPITQEPPNSDAGNARPTIGKPFNYSNPGTPASYPHLMAFSPGPTSTQEDSIDFSSGHSPSVDDILCQTLQSVSQEQREKVGSAAGTKEANLMPVPVPQQIQYLNTFQDQELNIQKQPNTSLKDTNSSSNTGKTRMLSDTDSNQCSTIGMSEVASPLTETSDRGFAGPLLSPRTPRTPTSNPGYRGFESSTTMQAGNGKMPSSQNSPVTPYGQSLIDGMGRSRAVPESPKPQNSSPSSNKRQSNEPKTPSQSSAPDFSGSGRDHMHIRGEHENLPLNPNIVNGCQLNTPGSVSTGHFDPITSLAQMSQLLANGTPNSKPGERCSRKPVRMPTQKLPQGCANPMQNMNAPSSEEEYGDSTKCTNCIPAGYNPAPAPRPAGNLGIPNRAPGDRTIGYAAMRPASTCHGESRGVPRLADPSNTRTNVHVKPGAPNTIQYLPAAKPNPCQGGPRPPPSLDFLQGFVNPQNQRFLPSNPQNLQNFYPRVGRPQRPTGFQPGNYRQMRPPMHQAQNLAMHVRPAGLFSGSRVDFGNKQFGCDVMPNQANQPQMYNVPGNPGVVMRIRPRGPSHPIHPNMEMASGGFKGGPLIAGAVPPTSDPNYAQQYHNFQQQLYATGTRPTNPHHPNLHQGTSCPSFLPER
ncbi:protein BCL9 homolog [Diprion similis]|uniref:protein BCL9 homolog n=1 Tax=Diprion similis TaxID=362088 RepID=UPI001EF81B38|nr:protein BCL9 homolog [Diprion similis]